MRRLFPRPRNWRLWLLSTGLILLMICLGFAAMLLWVWARA